VKWPAFILLFLFPMLSFGATYFIDFDGGNDANAGTSTAAAWKRNPYMTGFTGSYSHTAGDNFVHKGGVSWPSSCFRMSTSGGSSGAWDIYRATNNWFTGGAFTKPVFDLTGTQINDLAGTVIVNLGAAYNIISDVIFTNLTYDGAGGGFGNIGIGCFVADHQVITNCDFVGIAAVNGYSVDRLYIIGSGTSPTRLDLTVTHCTFSCLPYTNYTGTACYNIENVNNCSFSNLFTGNLGRTTNASHNIYRNLRPSTVEPANHPNACYVMVPNNGIATIHHNLFYNIHGAGMEVIYPTLWLVGAGQSGTFYIYDNLIRDNPNCGKAIEADPEPVGSGQRGTINIWNNTIVPAASGTLPIRIQDRGTASWGTVVIQNNHIISDYSGGFIGIEAAGSQTVDHNVTNSTAAATAQGYVTPDYDAVSSTNSIIDTGISLSSTFTDDFLGVARPKSAAWDIGAYEFDPGGTNPPVITSGNATGTNGVAFSYSITVSNGATSYGCTNLPAGLSVDGSSGVISGTPSETVTNTVGLFATNAYGFDYETITITILPPEPTLWVSASVLDYRYIATNTTSDLTFVVSNAGVGTLNGYVTNPSAPFSLIGTTNFSLSGTSTLTLTSRYSPTAVGEHSATLYVVGGAGDTVALNGKAFPVSSTTNWTMTYSLLTEGVISNSGNYVSITNQNIEPTDNGDATFGWIAPSAGNIRMWAAAHSTNGAADSWFVNVISPGTAIPSTASTNVWDTIPYVTNYVDRAYVHQRGPTGTFDDPDYYTNAFPVVSGMNQITFRGRETDMRLREMNLEFQADSTTNILIVRGRIARVGR
jgi:hypothetical protein